MPADIPGYYYDEERNRYFKIMPTGPHSLSEVTKARRAAEARSAPPAKTRQPVEWTFSEFRRARERCVSPALREYYAHQCVRYLYRQIKTDTRIGIDMPADTLSLRPSIRMDATSGDDFGELLLAAPTSCILRCGYQTSPFFHMWNSRQAFLHHDGLITSFAFSHFDGQYRHAVATDFTKVWRFSYRAEPPLSMGARDYLMDTIPLPTDHTHGAFTAGDGTRVGIPAANNSLFTTPGDMTTDAQFVMDQETFWTSTALDVHDRVITGTDRGIYVLNRELSLIQRVRTKSAVLAAKFLDDHPHLAWIGFRNGSIRLFDVRERLREPPTFQQGHAITHVAPIKDGSPFMVLSAAMNGSIHIWDARMPTPPGSPKGQPVKRLLGRVDDMHDAAALDFDPATGIVAAVSPDRRLRLWSIHDREDHVNPFWVSDPYDHVPPSAVRVLSDPPRPQKIWDPSMSQNRRPGVLVCASSPSQQPCISWLTLSSSS